MDMERVRERERESELYCIGSSHFGSRFGSSRGAPGLGFASHFADPKVIAIPSRLGPRRVTSPLLAIEIEELFVLEERYGVTYVGRVVLP